MERNEILSKLQDIIREAVDDDELLISDSTVATDVTGWDSLAQVLIVGELQNQMGIKFTAVEVSNCANVGEFVDAIISKL